MSPWPASCVYLITDRRRSVPSARTVADEIRGLEGLLDEAIDAGVDAIQVRERDLDARALLRLVRWIVRRADGTAVRTLVNDRADVARISGASGVHVPGEGVDIRDARTIGGAWIVGRSIHDGDHPDRWAGADYVLFGSVFPTASKPAGWTSAGVDALSDIVRSTAVPVIAVGGITEATAELAGRTGANGVAAIGAFLPASASGTGAVADAVRRIGAAFAAGRAHVAS